MQKMLYWKHMLRIPMKQQNRTEIQKISNPDIVRMFESTIYCAETL